MWIIAIAWIYVVALMSFTETSVVAGIITFVLYCMLPLALLFYLSNATQRKKRLRAPVQPSNPDEH